MNVPTTEDVAALLPDIENSVLRQVGAVLAEVCRLSDVAQAVSKKELTEAVLELLRRVADCDLPDLELILRGCGALTAGICAERFPAKSKIMAPGGEA